MVFAEIPFEEGDKFKLTDVHEKITNLMVKMLDEAYVKERVVNWNEFWMGCYDEWLLPAWTTDRAMKEAKERTRYKDAK